MCAAAGGNRDVWLCGELRLLMHNALASTGL